MNKHTIQVWDRRGKIKCLRLMRGRRRIQEQRVKHIIGMDEQRRKQAIYARLSSQDKKSDLDAQVNALKSGAPDADISSGLNFKRLLDYMLSKKAQKIYVMHEDRLALEVRFLPPFMALQHIREGDSVVNSKDTSSLQEELVQNLIAIISFFSAKLYGMKSHKTRKLLQSVKEVTSSQ